MPTSLKIYSVCSMHSTTAFAFYLKEVAAEFTDAWTHRANCARLDPEEKKEQLI